MLCETTYQYFVVNIITCWSDGYTLRNLKFWVTEVICWLAGAEIVRVIHGAEIVRVIHEFVRYPRIQLT